MVQYGIDTSANWEQIFFGEFEATYTQGSYTKIYQPIPKTNLDLIIDSPIVAIFCESNKYPNTKKYLGSIYQSILGAAIFPTATIANKGKSIYANETVLADFSGVDDDYDLVLNVRWWVEDIGITIFKYTGEVETTIEDRLARIEGKVDSLL